MPSRFTPIQFGTDPSQQIAMINKNFGELDAENVKKLYFDSNGIPSISLGIQSDGSSRIRVAKAGIDVTTATDDQLAFNSSQNTLKVVKSGNATLPGHTFVTGASQYGNNQSTVTIPHNLGFVPAILAYTADSGFYTSIPTSRWQGGNTTSYYRKGIDCSVDNTNIYFFMNSDGYNRTTPRVFDDQTIHYYLLQETAS